MSTNAPSRRRLLAGILAAAPIAGGVVKFATPAAASEPDPIFPLLAAERALWERCLNLEEAIDGAWRPRGRPAHPLQAEHDEAWRTHKLQINSLMATVPATRAGLDALIARAEEHFEGCMVDPDNDGLSPLLTTIRSFISREA